MLLLSRPLLEMLERQTFEHYTANMQTQIDASTPEEMRWLVMFPKVPLAADKEFRNRFGAVASSSTHAAAWIDGPLAERLADAVRGPLANDPPLVLMTLRGRLYLRLQVAEPDAAVVAAMVALFEVAAAQAVNLASGMGAGGDEAWPSTSSTAWQSQLQPEDPLNRSGG